MLLRVHQQQQYDACVHQLRMFIASGGAGKTVAQQACAIKEIRSSNFMQRQLISAPQSQICQQFARQNLLRLYCTKDCFDTKSKQWNCSHKVETWEVRPTFNLSDDASKDVLDRLEAFIMRPYSMQVTMAKKLKAAKSYEGLVVVTTHSAITRVYTERILPKVESGEYTKARVKAAVNNLTNRCDESHHCGGLTTKEESEQNGLGRYLSFCYKRGNKTARIFMTTATPYRESATIVGDDLFKKFHTYTLPFSAWCQYLGIEEIIISLEEYTGNTPIKNVAVNVGNEPNEKHLIIHPCEGEKWMASFDGAKGETKIAAMNKMRKAIAKALPAGKVIVETINPVGRKHVKKGLILDPDAADVWLTARMIREGVDVPSISRIHHTAMEQSKWLAVQTLYRAMRSYDGKKKVEIRYYIPKLKDMCAAKTREDFSDRVNLTLLLAEVRDILDPLLTLADIKTLGEYEKGEKATDKIGLDDIFSLLGVDGQKVKKEVYLKLEFLEKKTKANILQVIADILEDFEISDDEISTYKLDKYLLADYLLNVESSDDPLAVKKVIDMKFALRINPMDYIRTQFDGVELTGCGVFSGSYTPKSFTNIRNIFLNWYSTLEAIEAKVAAVCHLSKSERYDAAGLTPQECAWLKAWSKEL